MVEIGGEERVTVNALGLYVAMTEFEELSHRELPHWQQCHIETSMVFVQEDSAISNTFSTVNIATLLKFLEGVDVKSRNMHLL